MRARNSQAEAAGFQTMYLTASLMGIVSLAVLVVGVGFRRPVAAVSGSSPEG